MTRASASSDDYALQPGWLQRCSVGQPREYSTTDVADIFATPDGQRFIIHENLGYAIAQGETPGTYRLADPNDRAWTGPRVQLDSSGHWEFVETPVASTEEDARDRPRAAEGSTAQGAGRDADRVMRAITDYYAEWQGTSSQLVAASFDMPLASVRGIEKWVEATRKAWRKLEEDERKPSRSEKGPQLTEREQRFVRDCRGAYSERGLAALTGRSIEEIQALFAKPTAPGSGVSRSEESAIAAPMKRRRVSDALPAAPFSAPERDYMFGWRDMFPPRSLSRITGKLESDIDMYLRSNAVADRRPLDHSLSESGKKEVVEFLGHLPSVSYRLIARQCNVSPDVVRTLAREHGLERDAWCILFPDRVFNVSRDLMDELVDDFVRFPDMPTNQLAALRDCDAQAVESLRASFHEARDAWRNIAGSVGRGASSSAYSSSP